MTSNLAAKKTFTKRNLGICQLVVQEKKFLIFLKVFLKRKNKYGCKNTHISDD